MPFSPSDVTYLANLFNPQVVGDMINEKLIKNIVFEPMANIDYTLQGRAGDTVTLPYYDYIGDAQDVGEGTAIPISKLAQNTKQVKISKIGKGVEMTDESILSGYGDPVGEAVRQITMSIASQLDNKLLQALNGNTTNVYTPSSTFSVDDVRKAIALFGEEMDGQKALIVDPDVYAELLDVKSWVPASELSADMTIRGSVGMAYGCNIIVSERVKGGNIHIVKPGALAIYMKRDTLVEFDRDIICQTNVVTGSKLFAPYLYKPGSAIVIVRSGGDDGGGDGDGGDDDGGDDGGDETPNAKLSALSFGSLTLSPTFDADTTAYTTATENATNTITATAADENATVVIKNGEATVNSGSQATWADGTNTVTITVTNGTASKVYTVTVTKS